MWSCHAGWFCRITQRWWSGPSVWSPTSSGGAQVMGGDVRFVEERGARFGMPGRLETRIGAGERGCPRGFAAALQSRGTNCRCAGRGRPILLRHARPWLPGFDDVLVPHERAFDGPALGPPAAGDLDVAPAPGQQPTATATYRRTGRSHDSCCDPKARCARRLSVGAPVLGAAGRRTQRPGRDERAVACVATTSP